MSENDREIFYHIKLIPNPNVFESGEEPAALLHEIRNVGECDIGIHTKDIPQLSEFEPKNCYFFWHIILREPKTLPEVEEKLNAFKDKYSYSVEESDDAPSVKPILRPQKIGRVKLQNNPRVPKTLDDELKKIQRIRETEYHVEAAPPSPETHPVEKKGKRTSPEELKKVVSSISNILKTSNGNPPMEELNETINQLLALNDNFKSTGLGTVDWNEDLIEFVLDNDKLLRKLQKQVESIRDAIGVQSGKEQISPYEIWKLVNESKKG